MSQRGYLISRGIEESRVARPGNGSAYFPPDDVLRPDDLMS